MDRPVPARKKSCLGRGKKPGRFRSGPGDGLGGKKKSQTEKLGRRKRIANQKSRASPRRIKAAAGATVRIS